MRLVISFAALLLSITLLQLSTGAVGPLDALSGIKIGFSETQIGLLGSAHFLGFFIGCWWAPRLMGDIGHNRAFAVFAALGAIGLIAHPLFMHPYFWGALRLFSGLCIAGCYTVIEAWFQAKLTNNNRGRVMGAYRVVDIGASAAAQMMIGVLEPAAYVSYNLLAIICCACLLPLTLSKAPTPASPPRARLHPIQTALTSPLGVAGSIVAGITGASFRMVGPIYADGIGLSAAAVGQYLAVVMIGGALAQFPIGWLADRFDRRWVLIMLSIASVGSCVFVAQSGGDARSMIFASAFIFGFVTYPIYSVSTAHANDFCPEEKRIELNASLLFWFGMGAIGAPLITSALIQAQGPAALFYFLSAAHAVLIVFGFSRMRVRPSAAIKTGYSYVPRTSFVIGRLIRRRKLEEDRGQNGESP